MGFKEKIIKSFLYDKKEKFVKDLKKDPIKGFASLLNQLNITYSQNENNFNIYLDGQDTVKITIHK
jgi:hypothetical protein